MTETIYLDHAAATPLDPKVLKAMMPFLTTEYFNPSATYLAARSVRKSVENARADIAHVLGCRSAEVYFTAGGTESANLAIHGVMERHPAAKMLVSSIEHDAVLKPAEMYDSATIPVDHSGIINIDALSNLVDEKTVLISVMYANNEIGTIQPIKQIAALVANIRRLRAESGNELPLYLHSDACQAAAYLDLQVSRLGVDLLTINASKVYGPKQVGALYISAGTKIDPFILGGGQERGVRSGTENVAGVVGMAAALTMAQNKRESEWKRLTTLQQQFIGELEKWDGVMVNGSRKHRLPNNVHVTFSGVDNERLMMQLDEAGIQVAVGSACKASSEEPSHVLSAIGMTEEDAQSSIRITMGRSTDQQAVAKTLSVLSEHTGR